MNRKSVIAVTAKREQYYDVVFKDGKLESASFNTSEKKEIYYFNPKEDQREITNEFLRNLLTAMISNNISAFEIVYTAFEKQEYKYIAQDVFKAHWNKLYNTVVADDVFGRELAFSSICHIFDFFKGHR